MKPTADPITELYKGQQGYQRNMGIASNYQKLAGISSGAGAMSELFGGIADYSVLRFRAGQAEAQGRQAGIVAGEQSNLLMDKMIKDISNSFASYSARGITLEGTPTSMAGTSMKEAGEDIKTLTESAKIQEEAAEFEADQLKSQATLRLYGGILQAISGGAQSYGMLKGGF